MQANYVQRLRLTFTKTGPTRFISHLDLARTLERSLNRAHIPMSYTQGFNRRPRMSLATALPLGYTAQAQMMSKMAPGIEVRDVEEVALSEPALQTVTRAAIYTATPLDPQDSAEIQGRIDALLSAESVMRQRKKGRKGRVKSYDLRPLVHNLSLRELEDDILLINMELSLMPSQTGRPDEVLLALGLDPLAVRVHRTSIVLREPDPVGA